MTFWRTVGALVAGLSLALATCCAHALPLNSPVPGGVALVTLGAASAGPPPQAFLAGKPVWVRRADGPQDVWQAVVGLPLETPAGEQQLTVSDAEGQQRTVSFTVRGKDYPVQHVRLPDNSKVELADDDAQRALHEIAEIQDLKQHWRAVREVDAAFVRPANGRLGGRFGVRRYFNGIPRAAHSGLDLVVPRGTPVHATTAGIVLATGDYFFNGMTVFVDHGNGVISLYCHLQRIDVAPGEPVARGQSLGLSGMSGRASGPHLHWTMVLNGTTVDPQLFLGAD